MNDARFRLDWDVVVEATALVEAENHVQDHKLLGFASFQWV